MTLGHKQFATTTRGLNRNTPPMRLFEKAKVYGIWNPSDIDFSQDIEDYQGLADNEKDIIKRLTSLFVAGEEAVTLDLLPLIMVIAKEGRIEEEMFLTSFLWEEAKHTDLFQRFLSVVLKVSGTDLSHYHTENYSTIFYQALPHALDALITDQSPEALIKASVTYNMIVEGVLAETGYYTYFSMLQQNNIMLGQVQGVTKVKQDESRHIAYGIYLISRLVAEHPHLWDIAEDTMNTLLMPAIGIIEEIFALYDPVPFGLEIDDFINFAMGQFQKRMNRIEAARGKSLEEIMSITQQAIDANDA